MFGLHTFLQSIVRQQRFWSYGIEEIRDDSPQHACLRPYVSTIQGSVQMFLLKKHELPKGVW